MFSAGFFLLTATIRGYRSLIPEGQTAVRFSWVDISLTLLANAQNRDTIVSDMSITVQIKNGFPRFLLEHSKASFVYLHAGTGGMDPISRRGGLAEETEHPFPSPSKGRSSKL